VVRNPEGLERMPRETARYAAALAAGHSKLAAGGRTAVHVTTRAEVSKPRGYRPGMVLLGKYTTVYAQPAKS